VAGSQLWVKLIESDEGDRDLTELLRARMKSFEFNSKEMGISIAKFVLRNDDLALLDEPGLTPGQCLSLQWGWEDDLKKPRNVIVKKPRGTNPREILCFSEETLMDNDEVNQDWGRISTWDVVHEIAKRNKNANQIPYTDFFVRIADTQQMRLKRQITQKTTDARMLIKLAKKLSYLFWIDEMGLHFKPRPTGNVPVASYTYRQDLKGEVLTMPQFEENYASDINQVTIKCKDRNTKKRIEATYGMDKADFTSLADVEVVGDPFNLDGKREPRITRTVVRNGGYMTEEEALIEAERRYRIVAQERYRMTFDGRGKSKVRPNEIIEMLNVGDNQSGLWYVKECVDRIASGMFKQDVTAIRDALGTVSTVKKRPITRPKNDNDGPGSEEGEEELYAVPSLKKVEGTWEIVMGYYNNPAGDGSEVSQSNANWQDRLDAVNELQESGLYAAAESEANKFNAEMN
jgi:phage protein D